MTTILSSNITLLVLIDAQLLLNLIDFLRNEIHREIFLLGFSGSIKHDFSFKISIEFLSVMWQLEINHRQIDTTVYCEQTGLRLQTVDEFSKYL